MQDQILLFLKNSKGYISGEEISRRLNFSRAAIWKNIQELRKKGYEINAVSHRGYKLINSADKLFPQELKYNLNTNYIGNKFIHFETIPSTMEIAFDLATKGEEEGTVICAESQTKGKGRLGRTWVSPKGKGIYASIILRPKISPIDASKLTLLSAVAIVEAIYKITGVKGEIKWPNDILYNKKKIAGILTEMSAEMDQVRFVVIGVGINVNAPLSMLPSEATSLKVISKKSVSRVALLQEVLRKLEKWNDILLQEGFSPILREWKKHTSTLGKTVKVANVDGFVEGEAVDLDQNGGLVIKSKNGKIIKRMTGDVLQV